MQVDNPNIINVPIALPFSTMFEATGRFTKSVGGDGSQSFGTDGLEQVTSATSGSFAYARINFRYSNIFVSGGVYSCMLGIDTKGTTASSFYGLGEITTAGTGHTYTDAHIGFKILIAGSVASLYGTVGAGGTETATSALTTVTTGDVLWLKVENISNTNVKFYWRKNAGAWSTATQVTTNIPTSGGSALHHSVSNNSTASNTVIQIASASFQV